MQQDPDAKSFRANKPAAFYRIHPPDLALYPSVFVILSLSLSYHHRNRHARME